VRSGAASAERMTLIARNAAVFTDSQSASENRPDGDDTVFQTRLEKKS
jgi:hypothetical protein